MAELVFVELGPEAFAQLQGAALNERKGIESVSYHAEGDIDNGGVVGIELEIDNSAYKTGNFFKYRDAFEDEDNVEVNDKGNTVELVFESPFGCRAEKCSNCGTVYNAQLDEAFSDTVVFDDYGHFVQPI